MKIQFVGKKPKMTVTFPMGSSPRRAKKSVVFKPGEIHEFEEKEGQDLLDHNQHSNLFIEVDDELDEQIQEKGVSDGDQEKEEEKAVLKPKKKLGKKKIDGDSDHS